MSGGSFDYFYSRAPEALHRIACDLRDMAARCTDPAGWGREGVDPDELAAVGAYLGALALKVEGLTLALEKIERVTHDVEWWQSGDSGPDSVVESFKKAVPPLVVVPAPGDRCGGSRVLPDGERCPGCRACA